MHCDLYLAVICHILQFVEAVLPSKIGILPLISQNMESSDEIPTREQIVAESLSGSLTVPSQKSVMHEFTHPDFAQLPKQA